MTINDDHDFSTSFGPAALGRRRRVCALEPSRDAPESGSYPQLLNGLQSRSTSPTAGVHPTRATTNTLLMQPDPSLSDEELEELEIFLMSEEMPEDGMDISTLDGFLAAIVLNPHLIAPSRWLPWVWDMEDGEDSPSFADSGQANRILGLLMHHYNAVVTSISGGWFDPLWMELAQEDGSEFFDAEGWCAGFMLAIKRFPDAWQAVFKGHMELLAPMVLLGTETGWKTLEERGQDAETRKRLTQGAYEAIPAAVAALQEHFKPEREQALRSSPSGLLEQQPRRRQAPKRGRNDPCSCGSGKKYKKCCGASESMQ